MRNYELNDAYEWVSRENRARSKVWHSEGIEWSLADWSNAVAGEVGELANFIKKIRRLDTGTNAREEEQDRGELVAKAIKEIADVYLYLDLLLEQLDPDASMYLTIAEKFNETSRKFGFPHLMLNFPKFSAPLNEPPEPREG